MPDDIKDRALALVKLLAADLPGSIGYNLHEKITAIAREAEAAEKKWRIGVTHSWMEKKKVHAGGGGGASEGCGPSPIAD